MTSHSTAIGVFADHASAEAAIRELSAGGFAIKDLSIVGRQVRVPSTGSKRMMAAHIRRIEGSRFGWSRTRRSNPICIKAWNGISGNAQWVHALA